MRKLTAALACLAGLAWVGDAPSGEEKAEKVKFRLYGIFSATDADLLVKALQAQPSVKVSGKPSAEEPTVAVTFTPGKTDVGEMARAVGAAKTSARARGAAPRVTLVLEYAGRDGAPAPDGDALSRLISEVYPRLKGVDAQKSSFDSKSRSLLLMFDDSGKARLAEIRKGFPGLSLK
jgi:hypothetical protein